MPHGFAQYASAGRFWRILLWPGFKSVGISCCDGCNMPTVAPTIARSANNRQWMRYRTDRSFETGDFLVEKGLAIFLV
jgi:hypothetical protein